MKNSNIYKKLNIVLLIISYVAVLLLTAGKDGGICLVLGLVIYALLNLAGVPIAVFAFVNGKMTTESVSAHNKNIKMLYIPFFALNFFATFYSFLTLYDSSLLLGILCIILSVLTSYLIVLRTSLSNFAYFVNAYKTQKLKANVFSTIALIASFFFLADVIGAILLYNHEKNQIPEEVIKIGEKWKTRRHSSYFLFKLISIVASVLSFVSAISLFVIFVKTVSTLINAFSGSIPDGIENFPALFIAMFAIAFLASLVKLINGIIYGKNGEKNPINFVFVMKLVDLIPNILLLIMFVMFMILGVGFGAFMLVLLPCIVVIVVVFVCFALIISSWACFIFGAGLSSIFYLSILGPNMTLFGYLYKQRIVKNKAFYNPMISVCLLLLFIPVLDLVGIIILKIQHNKNGIFSEKPFVEIK